MISLLRFGAVLAVLCALTPASFAPAQAQADSSETVPYFTDNGFGNSLLSTNGVHHEGITYVCYQGPLEDAWVASYNHETGEWTGPFLAGVSLMGKDPTRARIDDHGQPSMVLDDAGHLHLAYGGHGGTRETGVNPLGNTHYGEQRHVVTTRPLDITEWELLDNVSPFGTYSQFIKMDNGDLYLIYRHGVHRSNWVYQLSRDNGRTFDEPVSFLKSQRNRELDAVDSWYPYFIKAPGDRIIARVDHHTCRDSPAHNGERSHGYFIQMSTRDHVWRNVKGEALPSPMTKDIMDRHAKAVDTGDDFVHGGPVALDSEGNPHFILYRTQDTKPYHGGEKTIFHYRWDGERWLENELDALPKTKVDMEVGAPNEVSLLVAGFNDENFGQVARWESTDGGATFEQGRIYYSRKGAHLRLSRPIVNAHPDARFMAARAQRSDYSYIFLLGDSGEIERDLEGASVQTDAQRAAPRFGTRN